jgi:hypothetical protein
MRVGPGFVMLYQSNGVANSLDFHKISDLGSAHTSIRSTRYPNRKPICSSCCHSLHPLSYSSSLSLAMAAPRLAQTLVPEKTAIVLGAAYGGARAAQVLAKELPEDWTLVLIDRNSYVS